MIQKISGMQNQRFTFPDLPSPPEYSCFEIIVSVFVFGIPFWIAFACALSGNSDSGFGWLAIIVIVGILSVRGYIYSAQKKQYEEALQWQTSAKHKLDQLYYCGREDIVFDPYDGTSAPA